MIDPHTEFIVSFPEAAKHPALRKNGKAPHHSAVRRWASNGVKRGDTYIRLETIRTTAGICTSREAIERFLAELTAEPTYAWKPAAKANHQTDADRTADAYLTACGI